MCMDQISGVTVSELLRREEKARQCRYSEDLMFSFLKAGRGEYLRLLCTKLS